MVWRLGTVPYLNAEPLAAALREPDAALLVGEAVELRAMVPAQLLEVLLRGELDAALVSTAGVYPHPELRILPDMCVASRGPVRSIQLYCRRPLETVRRVALDASSRSAAALARVLFAERWRMEPAFVTMPPDLPAMLAAADAALLIGDPALRANHALETGAWVGPPVERIDLGQEWQAMTGLPFVYAVWAARCEPFGGGSPGRLPTNGAAVDGNGRLRLREDALERLASVLRRARSWGLRRLGALAARGAEKLGLPHTAAREYLTEIIHYSIGPEERAGMERFCALAIRHGVLPEFAAVRFAEPAPAIR